MKSIDNIIKTRKTQKILSSTHLPIDKNSEKVHSVINELLELASSAPYHKKCNNKHSLNQKLNSCLPWRCYVLDSSNCRSLSNLLIEKDIKSGKINEMLAASDVLMLVTWLPEPIETNKDVNSGLFNGNLQNMEHIAAASAAIQNILLGATARKLPNYWSSGGILRNERMKQILDIPLDEILLGAIFLFPEKVDKDKTSIKTGALREYGKELNTWSKWIEINNDDQQ